MTTVRFRLGPTAQMCLGIDDPVLVREAFPSLVQVGPTTYVATVKDAKRLQDDLAGRADASEYGFDHTPAERAACRNAAAKLQAVLTSFSAPIQI